MPAREGRSLGEPAPLPSCIAMADAGVQRGVRDRS